MNSARDTTMMMSSLKPRGLTQEEKFDRIAFLKALTGEPIKFEMPKFPK